MALFHSPARARGFTMIEMSVVLVIIALLIGAMTVGRDVYRSAAAERLSNDYVQAWALAYERYVGGVGTVPDDDFDNPTGQVGGGLERFLCERELMDAVLARGIELPPGRGEGFADRYGYQDSRGQPHEARVCFGSVQWSEPFGSVGSYAARPRNVMRLQGLTPELATLLDSRIDGRVDARHGRFREVGPHAAAAAEGLPWSRTDQQGMNGASNDPDAQVAEVSAYLKMTQ